MSELGQLFDQLKAFDRPPVDTWWPDKTIEFDLRIAVNGDWFHEGGIIPRPSLVKLFSTVLVFRGGHYFLVTPEVKYRINVEDAPFMGLELNCRDLDQGQEIFIRTNMDEVVRLDSEHPLNVEIDSKTGEPSPYVEVRDGLRARLTRSVFYQLVDMCQPSVNGDQIHGVFSAGQFFPLH